MRCLTLSPPGAALNDDGRGRRRGRTQKDECKDGSQRHAGSPDQERQLVAAREAFGRVKTLGRALEAPSADDEDVAVRVRHDAG